MAPLRQAQSAAAIATLRQIDPKNLDLVYFANPGAAPSQEALDRLNTAVEAAAIKRVTDKVMPYGIPIGKAGRGLDVRELPGGLEAAADLFSYMRVGGTPSRSGPAPRKGCFSAASRWSSAVRGYVVRRAMSCAHRPISKDCWRGPLGRG